MADDPRSPTWELAVSASQPAHSQLTGERCHARPVAAARLLLVDDEDNLRSMLEAALRHSGFEVHPVANGRDAIDGRAPRCSPTSSCST